MTSGSDSAARRREAAAAVAVFGLLSAAFLLPSLRGGRVLLPSDLAFQYDHVWVAQAREAGRTVAQNPILADVSDYYYPYRVFALDQLRRGRVPLWNPYILAGTPFFASAQASLLDPVTAASLLAGPFRSWAWGAFARISLLGLFAYGLARELGRSAIGAAAAGAVFMVCGFVTVWLNYPVVTSLVWMPALLWSALRLVATGSRRALVAVAFSTGALLVGGHPETQFLVGLFFGAFCLHAFARLPAPRGPVVRRRAAALAIAVALGLALAAVQWVPFVQFLFQSHAFAERATPFAPFDLVESALRLAVLLLPKLGGTRMEVDYWMPPWTNYVEQTGYVGLLAIAIGALGLVAARRRGGDDARWATFLAIAAALAVGLAIRAPGLHEIKRLPLFDVGHGVRWVLVASLCVALLAARGIDAVRAADRAVPRVAIACAAAAALGWAVLAAARAHAAGPWLLETRGEATRVSARVLREVLAPGPFGVGAPLLFLAAGAAVLFAGARAGRAAGAAALALCALLYLDLWTFGHAFNPSTPERDVFPPNATLRHLTEHLGRERVAAAGTTLRPNVGMVFGLRDLRGYEDLVEGEFAAIYRPTLDRLLEENWLPSPRLTREEERLLQLGSVRFLLSPVPIEPSGPYRLVQSSGDVLTYENEATLPRAYAVLGARFAADPASARAALVAPDFDAFREVVLTGGGPTRGAPGAAPPVAWREDEAGTLALDATLPADGYLVVTDRFAPEWEATVDGVAAPILRANGAFRAVALGAGTHTVRFAYRPRLVYRCAALSGATLLVLIGLLVAPSRAAGRDAH